MNPRALIVDDEPAECELVRDALSHAGFEATSVQNAGKALDLLATRPFDVVLTDLNMPGMNGTELCRRISEAAPHVPVVLVDQHLREPVREAARSVGAAGYVVQPLDPERVAAGAQRILESRARRRFSRLAWRLSIRLEDGRGAFTTSVARLGAFIGAEWESPSETLRRCEIELPELGRVLTVDAERIYQVQAAGP